MKAQKTQQGTLCHWHRSLENNKSKAGIIIQQGQRDPRVESPSPQKDSTAAAQRITSIWLTNPVRYLESLLAQLQPPEEQADDYRNGSVTTECLIGWVRGTRQRNVLRVVYEGITGSFNLFLSVFVYGKCNVILVLCIFVGVCMFCHIMLYGKTKKTHFWQAQHNE